MKKLMMACLVSMVLVSCGTDLEGELKQAVFGGTLGLVQGDYSAYVSDSGLMFGSSTISATEEEISVVVGDQSYTVPMSLVEIDENQRAIYGSTTQGLDISLELVISEDGSAGEVVLEVLGQSFDLIRLK